MRIWIRNIAFFVKICGFATCGLGKAVNLRIWDLRNYHYKFVDLRLQNGSKNLRVCDLRAHLCKTPSSHLVYGSEGTVRVQQGDRDIRNQSTH